jgi:hypothetical protein
MLLYWPGGAKGRRYCAPDPDLYSHDDSDLDGIPIHRQSHGLSNSDAITISNAHIDANHHSHTLYDSHTHGDSDSDTDTDLYEYSTSDDNAYLDHGPIKYTCATDGNNDSFINGDGYIN